MAMELNLNLGELGNPKRIGESGMTPIRLSMMIQDQKNRLRLRDLRARGVGDLDAEGDPTRVCGTGAIATGWTDTVPVWEDTVGIWIGNGACGAGEAIELAVDEDGAVEL